MQLAPFNDTQRRFAESHHNLIYKFLHDKKLPEDEYYGPIAFGYLRAVQRYLTNKELQQYAFSTIAWGCMRSNYKNHILYQYAGKRRAKVISLNEDEPDRYPMEEVIAGADSNMENLKMELLLEDISDRFSERHASIVRLLDNGYTIAEISKVFKITKKDAIDKLEEMKCFI